MFKTGRSNCRELLFRCRMGAQRRDGYQRHASAAQNGPSIILLREERSDQTHYGFIVWEDADDLGRSLDLAAQPLDQLGGARLRPVHLLEAHAGEGIMSSLVHAGRQLWHLGRDLVDHAAPVGT